jgi:hypothetical protein
VYRTGQNLSETAITYGLTKDTFGLYCSYPLDGQVFGQPLVVTNVTFKGTNHHIIVYVVTMNDSVYAFDGEPPSRGTCQTQLAGPVSVLGPNTTEVPANCPNLGGGSGCKVIAPNVGVLGTPVISTSSSNGTTIGTLYLVAESQTADGSTFYHRLWALDITSLSLVNPVIIPIVPPTGCPIGNGFSKLHIQRPALLLGGDGYVYTAFSMMDGNTNPYPNGMQAVFSP